MTKWPKPLVLLVLALIALGAASCGSESANEEGAGAGAAEQAGAAGGEAADPVRSYVEFVESTKGVQEDAPIAADDIAAGLRQLAGVVGTLGVGRPELPTDLRVAAEHVLLNPDSVDVAATVRQALVETATALQMLPGANAASVQPAAEAIRADAALTSQPAAVRGFFRQAAAALAARDGKAGGSGS